MTESLRPSARSRSIKWSVMSIVIPLATLQITPRAFGYLGTHGTFATTFFGVMAGISLAFAALMAGLACAVLALTKKERWPLLAIVGMAANIYGLVAPFAGILAQHYSR